ncbi:MAG: restriction endonuclease [Candidatus Pacebacteria bacterium]|nr:restriction endonuclease [Candidatus Paceibacterota bacterium]
MVKTTRTLNPLPFGDLEPHRFEDMVRQLAYDFRDWISLEAVGRAGQDKGIDIRGVEIEEISPRELKKAENHKKITPKYKEKLWIIQCKREKEIGPKKVAQIVEESIAQNKNIYGFIIVAAANFSEKSRQVFREKCRSKNLGKFYL